MFYILSLLWFIREIKSILFYFYLWQIKEYHIGRFLDHFRTEKGRRLIKASLIKTAALFPFLVVLILNNQALLLIFLNIIILLYLAEAIFTLKNLFQKKLKMPVLTKKTVILVPSGLLLGLLLFLGSLVGTSNVFSFAFWLLAIDIFSLLVFSILVVIFQLPTVFIRNIIIKKAMEKRNKMKDLTVIGITGSYGKSSTKEFLATILSRKFKVLKTDSNQNSEMGISQCILKKLDSGYQIFIVEMGAYNRGGIKLLSKITQPRIGILTGINEQHSALFKSQDNIIKTKYELIESLPKRNSLAVFNGDNDYCLELYKKTEIDKRVHRTHKSFLGMKLDSDVWAENIKVERDFVSFDVLTKEGEKKDFRVNVLGAQNIANILSAIVVAKELGMNLGEISDASWTIKPEQGSTAFIKGREDPYILNATYSSNPDGVIADLDYLKIWPSKKLIVMPCLIELGKASKKAHRRIGKKIAEVCDLAVITTKERLKEIKEGAVSAGMNERNILFIEGPKEIIDQINIFSSPGDIVLLEGRVPEEVINSLT